jgi:hypothetical protein
MTAVAYRERLNLGGGTLNSNAHPGSVRLGSSPSAAVLRQRRHRGIELKSIERRATEIAAGASIREGDVRNCCWDDWADPWGRRSLIRQFPTRAHSGSEGRPSATAGSAHHSVGAGVGRGVRRVVRATEAVIVNFVVNETMSSDAKVLVVGVRHETCADAAGDACAKNSNAAAAQATEVSATKATDVATAKTTYVASAKATHTAAAVSSAAAAAASGLCTGCKKAHSKHYACQRHYHSSSHDILH